VGADRARPDRKADFFEIRDIATAGIDDDAARAACPKQCAEQVAEIAGMGFRERCGNEDVQLSPGGRVQVTAVPLIAGPR
jgi:hypothetical protein